MIFAQHLEWLLAGRENVLVFNKTMSWDKATSGGGRLEREDLRCPQGMRTGVKGRKAPTGVSAAAQYVMIGRPELGKQREDKT